MDDITWVEILVRSSASRIASAFKDIARELARGITDHALFIIELLVEIERVLPREYGFGRGHNAFHD